MFKEVINVGGKIKGNCDVDLTLKVAIDFFNISFDKAMIVSSDGDYVPLIQFLLEKDKFEILLSPRPVKKCATIIKKMNIRTVYLNEIKDLIK